MNINPFKWIHLVNLRELPIHVRTAAATHLLDTLGVAAAGTRTSVAQIMASFIRDQLPGDCPMLFTTDRASMVGSSLYGAAAIDSVDAHDGHVLTKGHAGVAVVPSLFALPGLQEITGEELLTRVVLGYEIATRAGIALHATAAEYHSSGAWNALGVAAIAARHLRLDNDKTAQALGIAEFYGPRSQMMRYVSHPTMVKDASSWGASVGISAGFLADKGFTGSPPVTVTEAAVADVWADLGQRWYILEQYTKLYPVCRWVHPAIEAICEIRERTNVSPYTVNAIEIDTFHEAKSLSTIHPCTSDEAQYSLPWAAACALVGGTVSQMDIGESELINNEKHSIAARVRAFETEEFNKRFPAERWAQVRLRLFNGDVLESSPCEARGDAKHPLSNSVLLEKYRTLTYPVLGPARANSLYEAVESLETSSTCTEISALVSGLAPKEHNA